MDYFNRARKFRTKKRLGQNFLVDGKVIEKIISEADISQDDTVLEIGPGIGFVTEKLVEKAKKVIAVEIDTDAIGILESMKFPNLKVIEEDILKINISDFTDTQVKVIANIPYYITSPILVHLLGEIDKPTHENRESVKEIILMVQYEVAKRIIANEKSQSKEYGLLSILANYWAETKLMCKVPAKCFYPAPKVDSALVKLTIREKPLLELNNPTMFRKVIKACFGKRRKNIKNALTMGGFESKNVVYALEKANIDSERRGETLSMQEFALVADYLEENSK